MPHTTQLRLAVAVALGVLLAPAIVRAAGDVSVVLTAQRVAVVDGKEVLGPAEQASPGDVIEYRAVYRNAGDGTFPTITSILAAGGVALGADFTGDGAPDIAGTSGVMGDFFALYVNAR